MSNKFNYLKEAVFYSQQDPNKLAEILSGVVQDTATSITISGSSLVENDVTNGTTAKYTSVALSQFGDEMTGVEVTLSLKEAVTGVSISGGTVTIANSVADGTVFIIKGSANSGAILAELKVTVVVPDDEE